MAVTKRKSGSITAEKPEKRVKKEKSAAAAAAPASNKKTLFGKVLDEEEEDDGEDEGELEAEPIRDDDEQNDMDMEVDAAANNGDQTVPQKNKIRKSLLPRFAFALCAMEDIHATLGPQLT